MTADPASDKPQRIAKRIARSGLCSRREAEALIEQGKVLLNGKRLDSPAQNVTDADDIVVDGSPLPAMDPTRMWLYHKPKGLVTTNKDPEGRTTIFDRLPADLPRVITVGRLDINTEGLLLLTNDGGLARTLELPTTNWLRRYRVRAFGKIDQAQLDKLAQGMAIDGVFYGSIEAELEKQQGDNAWLTIGLREGKNREIKVVLGALGLQVNRLIRLSFGPFQLGDLGAGEVREIRRKTLRDQLGEKLAKQAGVQFAETTEERTRRTTSPQRSGPKPAGQAKTHPSDKGKLANFAESRAPGRDKKTEKSDKRSARTGKQSAGAGHKPHGQGRPKQGKPAGSRKPRGNHADRRR